MSTPTHDLNARNRRAGLLVLFIVVAMVGVSFAAVPLYDLFCRVTGFGGTPMTADQAPQQIIDREITVRFNTDTDSNLPWQFKSDVKFVKTKIGQQTLVTYSARSLSDKSTGGTALYNVSPPKVGKYFRKIECFCFQEQIIPAGKTVYMPVMFFIDPAFADDPDMGDVHNITLSYTFYPLDSTALERALEDFYNQSNSAKQTSATSN